MGRRPSRTPISRSYSVPTELRTWVPASFGPLGVWKGRLGEPHYDGNVRKRRYRGTHEAASVRRNRRVRPAGIRARGWAGVPVRAGERRPGEATETSRGGIRRGVPYLGEGRQGARPGDRQRPQGEGRDRDEVRRTRRRAISPPSFFFSV